MRDLRGLWGVLGGVCLLTVACGDGLDDGDTAAAPGKTTQALAPSGLPPVNSLPTPQTVNEDSPLIFSAVGGNAISVSDGDNLTSTVQIIVTNGVFFQGPVVPSDLIVSGNGTFSVTFSGEIVDINVALDRARYVPEPNYNGASTLQMNSSDNNGEADFDVLAITVTAFNDPPVNNVPTTVQAATEDVPEAFNLSVTDVDVAGAPMAITLTASNSTLITLPTVVGLSFSSGDGSADATMAFTGTLPDINAALNGLVVTAPLNFIGPSTVVITSADQGATGNGDPGLDNDTVNITWAAVNDAPVNTVPGAQTIVEETTLTFSSANGNGLSLVDVDATTALVQVTLGASAGTITLGSPGLVSFTSGDGTADTSMTFSATLANLNTALNGTVYAPGANFAATATVTMTSSDLGNSGSGGIKTDVDPITVNVTGVNDAPANTVPGAQFTNEDVSLVFSSGNGNAITVADVDAPSLQVTLTAVNGTVTLGSKTGLTFQAGDGTADATTTFTGTVASINTSLNGTSFIPTPQFNGVAGLTVFTSDLGGTGVGGALTDEDTVFVTVSAVNDTPDAVADARTLGEDATLFEVTVLENDTAAPDVGETLTITAVSVPAQGTATISGGGTVVLYTPAADYHGPDSFTYTISDGNGGVDAATVTLTVTSINDLPVASDDSFTVTEDSPATTFAVRSNDTAAPDTGETLTITTFTAPQHGTAAITGTGANTAISYTPSPGYDGPDSFTYTISDGNGGTATATISVTVTPTDTQPVAVADALSVNEDGSGTVDVLANDQGLGDAPITVTIVAPLPSPGSVQLQGDGRTLLYTPPANYNGPDAIRYRITDADGDISEAIVTVAVLVGDDLPVAVDDAVTTSEDIATVISVLANDTGLHDAPFMVTIAVAPAKGEATVSGTTVSYVPAPDAFDTDTFEYTVTDGDGDASTATVTVTVTGINDAPDAVDDGVSTNVDTPIDIDVKDNDTDPDMNLLTVTEVTTPAHGTATINATGPAIGRIHYEPEAGYTGTDTFEYTISDGQGEEDVATVTVGIGLDTDGDGLLDVAEIDDHGTDPLNRDTDGDNIDDGVEVNITGTDPTDDDSDDDGFLDGNEDGNENGEVDAGETDPNDADSDGDGIQDGTESGFVEPQGEDTDPAVFVPDADPETTTDPRVADTDGGGVPDGEEDLDHNGRLDVGETDPQNASDDPGPTDTDADGVPDATDNCASAYNPNQADDDGDGIGNTCDTPADDGCGCRVGARRTGAGGGAALLLLGLGVALVAGGIRRRRGRVLR